METELFHRYTLPEAEFLARLGLGPGTIKQITVRYGGPAMIHVEVRPVPAA